MNKKIITLTLILSFFLLDISISYAQTKKKEIIGYVANWSAYRRNRVFNPKNIDYSRYTILTYAFYSPRKDGTLKSCDYLADKYLLDSKPNIVELAHKQGVKVMLSLGGWSLSHNFSEVAANPTTRKKMAEECVRLLERYQFDGIDVDWEYPTSDRIGGGPEDTQNFTLMLQEIRTAIDEYGKKVKQEMLLTAAMGADPKHFKAIEWQPVSETLDYINLMTYSTNGVWSEKTGHNSPLYLKKDSTGGCTHNSVTVLTEQYNVPIQKINIGLSFCGLAMICHEGNAGLGVDHIHKTDSTKYFKITKGHPSYYDILAKKEHFTEHWDEETKSAYLLDKDKNVFVTYENERSLKERCEYVNKMNAAGVIIWEVSNDYVETAPKSGKIKGTPLADAVVEALNHDPTQMKKLKRKRLKK